MRIIEIVFPVFAIAGLGYLFAWRGVFSAADVKSISRYVFTVAIPVLLFDSMAQVSLGELDLRFMLSYYLATLILYLISLPLARLLFGYDWRQLAAFGIAATFSNTVLIGLPIVDAAFGAAGVVPLLLIISIHTASLYFLAILTAEQGSGGGGALLLSAGRTVRALARNPIVIGLVLGLLANVAGLQLPRPVAAAVTLVRGSALPSALFVLGATLHQFKISQHLLEAGLIVAFKLLLHPALVWLLAFPLLHIDPLWGQVAVLTAAMPVGINGYIFAALYDVNTPQAATAILVSTTLSMVTISWLLALFL